MSVSGAAKKGAQGGQTGELLLGFDARLAPAELRQKWTATQREGALLRLDATAPLSVDYLVWPSAWPLDAKDPKWRGPIQGLWDDLGRLESHLSTTPGRWWIVAVTLDLRSVSPVDLPDWQARAGAISPATQWKTWEALGHDVADRFLTSSGLWFRPGESVETLRGTWAPHLNEHHLFGNFESAMSFRDLCDARAPEHAPHFVYTLFSGGSRDVEITSTS